MVANLQNKIKFLTKGWVGEYGPGRTPPWWSSLAIRSTVELMRFFAIPKSSLDSQFERRTPNPYLNHMIDMMYRLKLTKGPWSNPWLAFKSDHGQEASNFERQWREVFDRQIEERAKQKYGFLKGRPLNLNHDESGKRFKQEAKRMTNDGALQIVVYPGSAAGKVRINVKIKFDRVRTEIEGAYFLAKKLRLRVLFFPGQHVGDSVDRWISRPVATLGDGILISAARIPRSSGSLVGTDSFLCWEISHINGESLCLNGEEFHLADVEALRSGDRIFATLSAEYRHVTFVVNDEVTRSAEASVSGTKRLTAIGKLNAGYQLMKEPSFAWDFHQLEEC